MPELPEVEVICQGLKPLIVGKTIASAGSSGQRLRTFNGELAGWRLEGQKVLDVCRRSKHLVLVLSKTLLGLHLGMSGQLVWRARAEPRPAHTHVWLDFPGHRLDYVDPRRFGDIRRLNRPTVTSTGELVAGIERGDWDSWLTPSALGVEPLTPSFSAHGLYRASRGVQQAVKPWLMRGHVVVGVGNIYASEALYAAGIHPNRPAGRLSMNRMIRLALAIQEQLQAAISAGGSTLRDYRSAHGQPGRYTLAHKVYDREAEPCGQCGRAIRRLVQAQRSSFYCPGCQRA